MADVKRTGAKRVDANKYRDRTGRAYTKWIDSRGNPFRQYELEARGSSHRGAGSSSRHEEQTPRTTGATSTGYYQQVEGRSSVREHTATGGTHAEEPDSVTVYDEGSSSSYHGHGPSRDMEYHSAGGYNQPQAYHSSGSQFSDPSEGTTIDARMGNLGLGDNYSLASSPPQNQPLPLEHGTALWNTSQPHSRYIRGTEGQAEKLDKSYKVRNKDYTKFFRVGRVFSTLWTEGFGINTGRVDPTFVSEIIYKEKVHSKVRRFVVVKYREGDKSCTCLPVYSYDRLGAQKFGITLGDHGFIYSKDKPQIVQGLLPLALKVVLSAGNAHLQDPSLVNYRKVYTIETNVKVKDVGHLDGSSMTALNQNFQYVFLGTFSTNSGDMTPRATENDLVGIGGGVAEYATNPDSRYPTEESYSEKLSNTGYYQNNQAQYETSYQDSASTSQGAQTYRLDQNYDHTFNAGNPSVAYRYYDPNVQTANWPASSRDNEVVVQEEPEDADDISLPDLAEAQQETRQRRESRSDKGKGKKKHHSYR